MAKERLQKLIARSGLCSRREADRMVSEGRVTVNGTIAALGDKADPATDHIKVDGKRLKPAEPNRYVLLYKPRAVMTTCDDPEERTTVIDLVRPIVKERVFPVGRLDYQSEGLLLLTNDGDLAAKVTHPRYGVVREYMVKIRGDLDEAQIQQLRAGVSIDGHHVKPLSAVRVRKSAGRHIDLVANRGDRGTNPRGASALLPRRAPGPTASSLGHRTVAGQQPPVRRFSHAHRGRGQGAAPRRRTETQTHSAEAGSQETARRHRRKPLRGPDAASERRPRKR